MSTATLLKANPWVLPKWKQNFHGDVCCIRSAKFSPRYKFTSVKVTSSWNSAPIPTSKNKPSVSFNFEARSATSNPKEPNTNFGKNLPNFSILETLKWLKIPVLTMVLLPALFFMKINGHYAALALTGGSMGGHSFSSSRGSSSSGSGSRSSGSSGSSGSSWSSSGGSSLSFPEWDDDSPSHYQTRRSPAHRRENPALREKPESADGENEIVGDQATVEAEAAKRSASAEEIIFIVTIIITVLLIIAATGIVIAYEAQGYRASLIKLQVGLLIEGQSLQKDLNKIAETADTSNSDGWAYILNETTKCLIQNWKYWISGSSSVVVKESPIDAEDYFKRLSMKEREKFDEETLSNLNNIKKKATDIHINPTNPSEATHMVVTILVAFEGKYETLPIDINDAADIGIVLKKLQSTHKLGKLLAVNVLWAPQNANEIMPREELQRQYPHLKTFNMKE